MCFSDSFPPNNLVLSLLGLIIVQETAVETLLSMLNYKVLKRPFVVKVEKLTQLNHSQLKVSRLRHFQFIVRL